MTEAGILVDTNIVSFMLKGNPIAARYEAWLGDRLSAVSFITLGELYFWAFEAGWGESRRHAMEAYLQRFVLLPYTRAMAMICGEVGACRKRIGRPISNADAWIAACALYYQLA